MKEDEFDEWARSRLNGHSSAVPEDMWQRITGKNKKRRTIFFVFVRYFAAALFFICLGAGYFMYTNKATKTKNARVLSNKARHAENEPGQKTSPVTKAPDAEESAYGRANKKTDDNRDQYNVNSSKGDITSRQINTGVLNKTVIEEPRDSAKSPNQENRFVNNKQLKKQDDSVADAVTKAGTTTAAVAANGISALAEQEKNIPSRENTTKAQSTTSKINHSFIETYLSAGIPLNYPAAANAAFLAQSGSLLTARLSYAAGLNIGLPLHKGFLFKTGIGFSLVNGKLQYAQPGAEKKIWRVNYGNIYVPVLLGYAITARKVTASVDAGFIASAVSAYKKYIFDSTAIVSVADKNTYRAFSALGAYGGINLSFQINNANQFFAGAFYRRYLTAAAVPIPYSQRINMAGLSAGIRHNFLHTRHRK